MKFFLDSANFDDLRPLMRTGLFKGVTTNPTIFKRDRVSASRIREKVEEILSLGAQEVFVQVWGGEVESLVEKGTFLSSLAPQVIVKIPATQKGFEAASLLAKDGIKTCITAAFATPQALLADAVEAAYVAPYLGRLNDDGQNGLAILAQMAKALRETGAKTEILAASIRRTQDIAALAEAGVQAVTLAPQIAKVLFDVPLTLKAAKQFEADAQSL